MSNKRAEWVYLAVRFGVEERPQSAQLRRPSPRAATRRLRPSALRPSRAPDGTRVNDPASRFQPQDVHGASETIDHQAHRWRDHWSGRAWDDVVLYEWHIGAFTPEGSVASAARKLDHLAELGVTAVEIMMRLAAKRPGRPRNDAGKSARDYQGGRQRSRRIRPQADDNIVGQALNRYESVSGRQIDEYIFQHSSCPAERLRSGRRRCRSRGRRGHGEAFGLRKRLEDLASGRNAAGVRSFGMDEARTSDAKVGLRSAELGTR